MRRMEPIVSRQLGGRAANFSARVLYCELNGDGVIKKFGNSRNFVKESLAREKEAERLERGTGKRQISHIYASRTGGRRVRDKWI